MERKEDGCSKSSVDFHQVQGGVDGKGRLVVGFSSG